MGLLGKIFSSKSTKVYEITNDSVSVYDDNGNIKGFATTYGQEDTDFVCFRSVPHPRFATTYGQEDTVYYSDIKTNTTITFDRYDHGNGCSTITKDGKTFGSINDFGNGKSEYYDRDGRYITTVDNSYNSFNSDSTLISEYFSTVDDTPPQKEGFLSFLFGNGSLPSSKSDEIQETTSTSVESSYNYYESSYSDSYYSSSYDPGNSYSFDYSIYDDDDDDYDIFDDDDDDYTY